MVRLINHMHPMTIDGLVNRVDELLALGEQVLATKYTPDGRYSVSYVKPAPMAGFRTATLSFIDRVYGNLHPHFSQFSKQTEHTGASDAERGIAILQAIRSEISGGWLFSIKGLVTAELFSNFLDMAEHLHAAGYKDPAAVMIGSVLEEHLRQLCIKHSIDVTEDRDGKELSKKADRLNSELAKADVYTKLDQKQITAWLDLRNSAAHGKYDQYNGEQVLQFLNGVVSFMARVAP